MSKKKKPGRKPKNAKTEKTTVRIELKGELRKKFQYLMDKYGTTSNKSLVAILIAEKYIEMREEEKLEVLASKLGRGNVKTDEAPLQTCGSVFTSILELRNCVTQEPLGYYVVHPERVEDVAQTLKSSTIQKLLTSQNIRFVPHVEKNFLIFDLGKPDAEKPKCHSCDIFETAEKIKKAVKSISH